MWALLYHNQVPQTFLTYLKNLWGYRTPEMEWMGLSLTPFLPRPNGSELRKTVLGSYCSPIWKIVPKFVWGYICRLRRYKLRNLFSLYLFNL
jgi:hypothetical protein